MGRNAELFNSNNEMSQLAPIISDNHDVINDDNDDLILATAGDNHEPFSGVVKLEYCQFLVSELDRGGSEESQREEEGERSPVSCH